MQAAQITQKLSLLSALLGISLPNTALAGAVPVDPKTTVTATMDGGILKTGNTWYEIGVNTAAPTTGLRTGLVPGQADPLSTYLIRPAEGNNALMLDTNRSSGSLSFQFPLRLAGFSLAGASGNGAGKITPTLHFTDNTTDTLTNLTVGDWFNNNPRVETTMGRIDVGKNVFNNVGQDNPRVLAINDTLSLADSLKFVDRIDFTWKGAGSNTHTALFGLSGDLLGIGHYTAIPLTDGSFNQDIIVGVAEVPEPSTLCLLSLSSIGLLAFLRRRAA